MTDRTFRAVLMLTLGTSLAQAPVPAVAQDDPVAEARESAPAPSAYGCARLEEVEPIGYIEGRDGVFFRLGLDLRMSHALTDSSVAMLAQLSDALAARGTTLVYVPLPTKALAMPDALPDAAQAYGYDHAVATTVFQDGLARLREAGVLAVDAQAALMAVEGPEPAFIATDFHWSSSGARAVAEAVAAEIASTPDYADLPRTAYETTSLGVQELISPVRREIQERCAGTVPPSATEAFETVVTDSVEGGSIFAAEAGGPSIALVGTSMSRTDAFNFDGALAQATGLDLVNYAITGGNQYGAIISYMLTDEFLALPPRYLVWENPIYNNLAEFGEMPLRELIAVAEDNCTPQTVRRPDPNTLVVDLAPGDLSDQDTVRADAGAESGRIIEIGFLNGEGERVSAMIERTQRLAPTRQFYQHVEPYWEPDLSAIEVRFDRPVGDDASLALCQSQEIPS